MWWKGLHWVIKGDIEDWPLWEVSEITPEEIDNISDKLESKNVIELSGVAGEGQKDGVPDKGALTSPFGISRIITPQ